MMKSKRRDPSPSVKCNSTEELNT